MVRRVDSETEIFGPSSGYMVNIRVRGYAWYREWRRMGCMRSGIGGWQQGKVVAGGAGDSSLGVSVYTTLK